MSTENGGITWSNSPSGVTTNLHDVACIGIICVAVGDGGKIIWTDDFSKTWQAKSSGTSQTLRGVGCGGTTCVAVGGTGTSTGVISTDGAASSWAATPALGNTNLFGVDCPNAGTCTLVGDGGAILGRK